MACRCGRSHDCAASQLHRLGQGPTATRCGSQRCVIIRKAGRSCRAGAALCRALPHLKRATANHTGNYGAAYVAWAVVAWLVSCAGQTLAPAERAALMDFYASTNGPGWTQNSGVLGFSIEIACVPMICYNGCIYCTRVVQAGRQTQRILAPGRGLASRAQLVTWSA